MDNHTDLPTTARLKRSLELARELGILPDNRIATFKADIERLQQMATFEHIYAGHWYAMAQMHMEILDELTLALEKQIDLPWWRWRARRRAVTQAWLAAGVASSERTNKIRYALAERERVHITIVPVDLESPEDFLPGEFGNPEDDFALRA